MELDKKALGAAIKTARLENKLTQERLAENINVAPVHIKQVEAGSRKPSIDVLYRLAVTLNISIDAVFFPERMDDGRELQHKIERCLNNCSLHELNVIYTTVTAMINKPETNKD
jgi:transcriptional regulator with XRE-family HTH domain